MLDAATHVVPLSLDTSKPVIALPPSFRGAVQARVTWVSPAVAVKFCGAVGGALKFIVKGKTKGVPIVMPLVIEAITFTVPSPVALTTPPVTDAPGAVLPPPKLHCIVWLAALLGTTVPLRVRGMPTVPVVGKPVMPVTEI